jgi:hypothetical protein
LEIRRVEQVLQGMGWRRVPVLVVGEATGKVGRRVNTVQKCVHMYVNAKILPMEVLQQ